MQTVRQSRHCFSTLWRLATPKTTTTTTWQWGEVFACLAKNPGAQATTTTETDQKKKWKQQKLQKWQPVPPAAPGAWVGGAAAHHQFHCRTRVANRLQRQPRLDCLGPPLPHSLQLLLELNRFSWHCCCLARLGCSTALDLDLISLVKAFNVALH